MSYAGSNTYYAPPYQQQQQQPDAYYYDQAQQQEDNTIDMRPSDITDQQDQIIQLVAKYVVFSCDGARYQHKLTSKTRFNSYFAFIASPNHKYHEYYQYLVRSYTVWRDLAAANAMGQPQTDEGYVFYTEALRQQEQQQQQMMQQANMHYMQPQQEHTHLESAPPYMDPTAANPAMGSYYDANSAPPYAQPHLMEPPQHISILGAVPATEEAENTRKRPRTPQESSDDEDQEEGMEFEFVMENGVARAVPKQK